MKYFELHAVLLSVLAYASYGALCGSLYPLADRIVSTLIAILKFPYAACRTASAPSHRAAEARARTCLASVYKPLRHAEEFLFIFLCGIGFLLLTYIVLDGMLRLYGILLFAAMFFILRYTLGRFLYRVYDTAAQALYRELLFLTSLVLYPPVHICRWGYLHVILPPCRALRHRLLVSRSRRKMMKKRAMARSIFEPQSKSTKRNRETYVPLAIFMQSDKNPLNERFFVDKNNKK